MRKEDSTSRIVNATPSTKTTDIVSGRHAHSEPGGFRKRTEGIKTKGWLRNVFFFISGNTVFDFNLHINEQHDGGKLIKKTLALSST